VQRFFAPCRKKFIYRNLKVRFTLCFRISIIMSKINCDADSFSRSGTGWEDAAATAVGGRGVAGGLMAIAAKKDVGS
jgi:hypothetical protein